AESIFHDEPVTTSINVLTRSLDAQTIEYMKQYAEKDGITLSYIFMSSLALYLSRATDRNDVVLLMTRLNRTPEQRGIIGCYTMLIPVVVHIDENETFADLCRKVYAISSESSKHKQIGYKSIASIAKEQTGNSGDLSEYVFNFYRFEYQTDLPFHVDFSVAGIMNNHATVTLYQNEKGRDCRIDYRSGIYTEEKAEFLFEAISNIMFQAMQSGGNRPIKEFSCLSDIELQKLASVHGKQIVIDESTTIPSLLRKAAFIYSGKPALYAGGRSYTFRELDELTDRIALNLIDRGIKTGDKVLFMLKRSYGLIPAFLGISKAGAVFIPVDPAYPAERVKYIIQNSGAHNIISSPDVDGADQYDYISIDELMEKEPKANEFPEIKQDSPCYMIYTSGTTGRPKGVILSHKGIANITHFDNNPFNRCIFKECRGIVAIGSICFDISLFEILVPLFNGKFIELGSEKAMLDASELARAINAHQADMLHCTPSRVIEYLNNEEFRNAIKNVKAMLMAGEVLPGKLVKQLNDEYGIKAFNGYGPTETTIGATITEAGDTKTIGSPIANTGIAILGKNRKQLPYGATGEICIYGNGVGIGYQNLPEQTEDRFITFQGVRMYRTGDLGRFTEDGKIIYEGRNDSQIKLRGLRIELSEIENMILSYPGAKQVACIVKQVEKTEHLVAFYTTQKDADVDPSKLKTYLEGNLTRYMVPDVLMKLDTMPQTTVGKMDRKALKEIPVECKTVFRAPESAKEKSICAAFCEVLKKDQVGLDDSFFEIGGDSLKAATLMVQIEQKLDLKPGTLEFSDIYKYYTPALLCELLEGKAGKDYTGYDLRSLKYDGIDEYLKTHCTYDGGKVSSLGTVLLTGATGYLGVHILAELIRRTDICDKIICIARPSKRLTAERRVSSQLFYFEGFNLTDDIAKDRCTVLDGDITDPDIFREKPDVRIDTIINAAANVSHFAYGDILERVNISGVKNLIEYAKKNGCAVYHVSTISVGGISNDHNDRRVFDETDFFIDQLIFNQYIYTKYMAEYHLLRAAVDDGLKVKIFRVGNLQGRRSDGEFQMNKKSNAFTRQLTSYLKLNCVPESVYNAEVNFSPVDETARNIVALATTGDTASVFHVSSDKGAKFQKIFEAFKANGYETSPISDDAFEELLNRMRSDENEYSKVEGLLTERPSTKYYDIPIKVDRTMDMLHRLGCGWLDCTDEYLNVYAEALSVMIDFM
ncbi:MAG: amino acid adenylation domain-containing protein, partial [Firmicutes bacterium]|nr:amino acid adenylation domain-containing protein [Candidatus Colimorpha enterica]